MKKLIILLSLMLSFLVSSPIISQASNYPQSIDMENIKTSTINITIPSSIDLKNNDSSIITANQYQLINNTEKGYKVYVDSLKATATNNWELVSKNIDFPTLSKNTKKIYLGTKIGTDATFHDLSSIYTPDDKLFDLPGQKKDVEFEGRIGPFSSETQEKISDLTFTLHSEGIKYQIKYDPNTGTGNTPTSSHVYGTPKDLNSNSFSKYGYGFNGWNTEPDGSGTAYADEQTIINLTDVESATVTLYAQWKPNEYTYDIQYVSNSGKMLGTNTVKGTFGSSAEVSAPDIIGYTTPANQIVEFDSASTKTITFTYPIIDYSISYTLNDGEWLDTPTTTYNIESDEIILKDPIKDGYTFTGWTGSNGDTPSKTVSIPAGSFANKSFIANWDINTYNLIYNANGGSVDPTNKSLTYDTEFGPLPTPTRTGYTFKGWYTAASGGTQVSSTTKIGANDTTIYAHWEINSYILTFDANGGNVSQTSKTLNYGSQYGSLPTPTKTGYDFVGWYTSPTGGIQVDSSTTMGAENTTIYARYEESKPTFTFFIDGSSYSAEEGMGWGNWIYSKYNTHGNLIIGPSSYVQSKDFQRTLKDNGDTLQFYNTIIIPGNSYYLVK